MSSSYWRRDELLPKGEIPRDFSGRIIRYLEKKPFPSSGSVSLNLHTCEFLAPSVYLMEIKNLKESVLACKFQQNQPAVICMGTKAPSATPGPSPEGSQSLEWLQLPSQAGI